MQRRILRGRQLLVASIGVATVNLGSFCGASSGNLIAPPPGDYEYEGDAIPGDPVRHGDDGGDAGDAASDGGDHAGDSRHGDDK